MFKTALTPADRLAFATGDGTVPVYELHEDGYVKMVDRHNLYDDIQLLAKSCDSVERILSLFTATGDSSLFPTGDGQYLDLTNVPDDPAMVADWAIAVNAAAAAAADHAAEDPAANKTNDAGSEPAESEDKQ